MLYKITERELKDDDTSNDLIKYEVFHFDDFIKLEVFHKGLMQKNSKLGKAFLNIRDLDCKPMFIEKINESNTKVPFMCVPVSFKPSNYGEQRERVNGMIFLKVSYQPRSQEVFYAPWREVIYNISSVNEDIIDRFEHMNDFLANDFTDSSQYGTLMIELNSVCIPKYMKTSEKDNDGIENLVFMLKVKVGKETRIMLVGAPDQIYGDPNQRECIQIHSTVQSLRDLVYIEFYDVLNEEDFDPRVR